MNHPTNPAKRGKQDNRKDKLKEIMDNLVIYAVKKPHKRGILFIASIKYDEYLEINDYGEYVVANSLFTNKSMRDMLFEQMEVPTEVDWIKEYKYKNLPKLVKKMVKKRINEVLNDH
jgi:hypothetical protein